jgi:hypothetical protein
LRRGREGEGDGAVPVGLMNGRARRCHLEALAQRLGPLAALCLLALLLLTDPVHAQHPVGLEYTIVR